MQDFASLALAIIYHDSGRAPVADGQTLAHAVQSPQVRPFIEWPDLPADVQAGRRMTARALLDRYMIGEPVDGPASTEDLAAAIHDAERGAIDAGLVLVKLNRPWIPFAELPEPAKEGRRRQARYLLARLWFTSRADSLAP